VEIHKGLSLVLRKFWGLYPIHQVDNKAWSMSDSDATVEGQNSNSYDKHKIKALRTAAREKYKYLKCSLQ